jgi:hypothetical protein
METEKRIGDFRVNRKVSWGITFPQSIHNPFQIKKPFLDAFTQAFSTASASNTAPLFRSRFTPSLRRATGSGFS